MNDSIWPILLFFVAQAPMIILEENSERLACTLIDVSKTGAKLSLGEQRRLPEIILLSLTGNGGAIRKCAVAWQNAFEIGVRFI